MQPLPEAEREARRRVIANNKAWASAEVVRREWLTVFLTRKSAPKGAAVFIATELAHGSHELRRAMEHGSGGLLGQLLGAKTAEEVAASAAKATDVRAQVIGLAFVLAAYEAATGKHTWRNSDTDMARYFGFLETSGYQLSDVEKLVIGAPEKRRAAPKPVVTDDGGDTA